MTTERKKEIGRRLAQIALELTTYAEEYSEEVGKDVTIEINGSRYYIAGIWRSYGEGRLHVHDGENYARYVRATEPNDIRELLTTERNDYVKKEEDADETV